jgi:hypothetical protein
MRVLQQFPEYEEFRARTKQRKGQSPGAVKDNETSREDLSPRDAIEDVIDSALSFAELPELQRKFVLTEVRWSPSLVYALPMANKGEPIQSHIPSPGLTPLELAQDLLSRIDQGNKYARSKKRQFRSSSSAVRLISLLLTVSSTIILGLQTLNVWTGTAFALIAVVTTVNSLEPFFAWRARWVLMEETQYKFYRLRDDVSYYIAANKTGELEEARIRQFFDRYQTIWDQLSNRWLEYRRASERND